MLIFLLKTNTDFPLIVDQLHTLPMPMYRALATIILLFPDPPMFVCIDFVLETNWFPFY